MVFGSGMVERVEHLMRPEFLDPALSAQKRRGDSLALALRVFQQLTTTSKLMTPSDEKASVPRNGEVPCHI